MEVFGQDIFEFFQKICEIGIWITYKQSQIITKYIPTKKTLTWLFFGNQTSDTSHVPHVEMTRQTHFHFFLTVKTTLQLPIIASDHTNYSSIFVPLNYYHLSKVNLKLLLSLENLFHLSSCTFNNFVFSNQQLQNLFNNCNLRLLLPTFAEGIDSSAIK